jgi:hypothetical protein
MPINTTKEPFRFAIFNDSKSEIIPDLPFGLTEFQIQMPIYSVEEFLKQLNDVILKKADLGQFVVNEDDYIIFSYDKSKAEKFEYLWIYFDLKLTRF